MEEHLVVVKEVIKMKKTIIFTLIGLIILVGATAYIATNKEDMLSYFNIYKTNRENEITNAVITITYTTDKECKINYYSEKIECEVCFDFTMDNIIVPQCIGILENSITKEDDNRVKEYVKQFIEQHYPIEEIKYIKTEMKDREISIN